MQVYGRQGSAWRQLGKDVSGEAEDDRAGCSGGRTDLGRHRERARHCIEGRRHFLA